MFNAELKKDFSHSFEMTKLKIKISHPDTSGFEMTEFKADG